MELLSSEAWYFEEYFIIVIVGRMHFNQYKKISTFTGVVESLSYNNGSSAIYRRSSEAIGTPERIVSTN